MQSHVTVLRPGADVSTTPPQAERDTRGSEDGRRMPTVNGKLALPVLRMTVAVGCCVSGPGGLPTQQDPLVFLHLSQTLPPQTRAALEVEFNFKPQRKK